MRRIAGSLAALAGVTLLAGWALSGSRVDRAVSVEERPAAGAPGYTYAPGFFTPEYAPPAPGSYSLPVIQRVADHPLIDAERGKTTLFTLKGDRTAIVAFIYSSCAEATGCPLSTGVLHRLDSEIAADRELAGKVTLVTISFDPQRDVPRRMAALRELHEPKADWRFATSSGEAELAPLLADFDQSATKLHFPDGRWSGLFRHVLKVFLLDSDNRVRNVYSVGFLNSELLLADLHTLARTGGA